MTNCMWKMVLMLSLLLLTPSFCKAQRDRGSQYGGGRPRFDPGAIFEKMSKGKGHVDLNSIPSFFRRGLDEYAKKNGITNGRLTRDQFMKYVTERGKRMKSGGRQDSKNSSSSRGDRNSRSGSSRNARSISKADFQKQLKKSTDGYFYPRDKNKDSVLDESEMSSRLKPVYKKYDRNGDGKISYDEAENYIRGYVERQYGISSGDPRYSRPQAGNTTVDQSNLEKRAIVYRAGNVPDSLPSWFKSSDIDADSQVGLYEWRTAGKDLDDFDKFDRNGDGFLTVEEMLYHEKFIAKKEENGTSMSSSGSNNENTASPSNGAQSDSNSRSRLRDFFNRRRKGG